MRRYVLVLLALVAIALPAAAQVQYGTVSGVAVDQGQLPLPGVTVTLSGPAMQGSRSMVTDSAGRFRFIPVPPGAGYTLTLELSGFTSLERTGLVVNIGSDTAVSAQISAARVAETLSVTGERIVLDPTKSTLDTNVEWKLADTLPNNRFFTELLSVAPGVRPANNPMANGGFGDANLYLIDGVDTTDPIYLTWGTVINWDIIQETQVQTAGFSAEYGRSTGAVMNLVTKSGGNAFSVLARFTQSKKNWGADFGSGKSGGGMSRLDSPDPSIAIGGPILKDKLWFFTSYENIDQTRNYSYYSSVANANANQLTNGTTSYKGHYVSGKLTWQPTTSHSFMAFYNEDPIDFWPLYAGWRANPYFSPTAERSQFQGSKDLAVSWTGVLSQNSLFEVKYQDHRQKLNIPAAGTPWSSGMPYLYDQASGYNYGAPPYDFNSDRFRQGVTANGSYFLEQGKSSHELKGGVEYLDSTPKSGWTYTTAGWYRMNGSTPIRKDIWTDQTGMVPYGQKYYALFVQDKWRVGKLTVSAGIRAESADVTNNADRTLIKFGLDKQIAPRLGFAYDLNGDSLHASAGRFYYMPSAYLATYFSEIPDRHLRYSWNGTCDPAATDVWKQPDSCWNRVFNIPVAGGGNTIDPNLRTQYTDEYTVGFDKRVSNLMTAGVNFVWRKQDRTIDFYDPGATYYYYITNTPQAAASYPGVGSQLASKPYWEYQALQLNVQKRFGADGFQFIASYTYVIKANGWPVGGDTGNKWPFLFWAPETMDPKRYGTTESPHYLKLNGSYTMPWRTVLGVSAYWTSGNLYTPVSWHYPDGSWTCCTTWFVDKLGSKRVGNNWEADLRIEQPFKLGPVQASVFANVFNAFNNQQPTARRNNIDFPNYGQPYIWQDPRWFQVGVKIAY